MHRHPRRTLGLYASTVTHPRTSRKHRNDVGPLWVWIAVAVLATVLVGAALVYLFAAISGYGVGPFTKRPGTRPELFDITRSAVAAGAFLGAAVVAAITVRRQRSTELSFEADELSRLRDRYTTAAGQLGHESPAVRLAGAYALAALADEWLTRNEPAEAQTSIDLLCAYMRTPRGTPNDVDKAADREIRQSIIRIITGHLQESSQPSWSDRDFDFTGAVFDGTFDFDGATFSGDRVSFFGATFSGDRVSFSDATFSGERVNFEEVTFSSEHVPFTRSTFSGEEASFSRSTFSCGQVNFSHATFSGDWMAFTDATFSGDWISFSPSTFSARHVDFRGATFSGAQANFYMAVVTDGCRVEGPWPAGPLPEWWPVEAERDPDPASS